MSDSPNFSYKKLVRESWYKKLLYRSRTQNHPRQRQACNYRFVCIKWQN